jgi:glutathione S-transferase
MKLFYSPGACSLSPHIALREAGLAFDLVRVDLNTKTTADGGDYLGVNPAGYVPALQLDDGSVLTEGPAIVQYVADRAPERRLAPANGTMARYKLQQWLNFVATEIHKSYSPLFNPAAHVECKAAGKANLERRLPLVAAQLERGPYLLGEDYTVADCYLFVTLSWAPYVALDLTPWPALHSYSTRVAARDAVQAALRAEGLSGHT